MVERRSYPEVAFSKSQFKDDQSRLAPERFFAGGCAWQDSTTKIPLEKTLSEVFSHSKGKEKKKKPNLQSLQICEEDTIVENGSENLVPRIRIFFLRRKKKAKRGPMDESSAKRSASRTGALESNLKMKRRRIQDLIKIDTRSTVSQI